jgi:hypothetical protein
MGCGIDDGKIVPAFLGGLDYLGERLSTTLDHLRRPVLATVPPGCCARLGIDVHK